MRRSVLYSHLTDIRCHYEKGFPITGFEKFEGKDDYYCFHAGTAFDKEGRIVTNGGRVLGITATGKDLKGSQSKSI